MSDPLLNVDNWRALHEKMRWLQQLYYDDAKQEQTLTDKLSAMSMLYHREVKHARFINAW
jgi:hypothetical protein